MATSGEKPTNDAIAKYLETHIKWADTKRMPSATTVGQILTIGAALAKSSRARTVLQLAETTFGRSTIFDEYSKLLLLVQRCPTTTDFEFVMEGLYTGMVRSNNGDKVSKADLQAKFGDIAVWLFLRRYFLHLTERFQTSGGSEVQESLVSRARVIFTSPLAWIIEFPMDRSQTNN